MEATDVIVREARVQPPPTADVCPYLLAGDGAWRSSAPDREHRCTAVSPAAVLAPDKQRRLCLSPEHAGCSTYRVAARLIEREDPAGSRSAGRMPIRTFTRTAPLVLDHGRMSVPVPTLRPERGVGQFALVGLMALALVAIVATRFPAIGGGGGPDGVPAGGAASERPSTRPTSAAPTPDATTDVPTRTLVPTEVEPSAPPDTASPALSPAPGAPGVAATYKVRRGDTLSGIASEFGTTWQAIAELNGIDDPGRLKVGQVLVLP